MSFIDFFLILLISFQHKQIHGVLGIIGSRRLIPYAKSYWYKNCFIASSTHTMQADLMQTLAENLINLTANASDLYNR